MKRALMIDEDKADAVSKDLKAAETLNKIIKSIVDDPGFESFQKHLSDRLLTTCAGGVCTEDHKCYLHELAEKP